jgi:hypothetical protein
VHLIRILRHSCRIFETSRKVYSRRRPENRLGSVFTSKHARGTRFLHVGFAVAGAARETDE